MLRPYHSNHNSSWYGIRTGFSITVVCGNVKPSTRKFFAGCAYKEAPRAKARLGKAGPPWRMKKQEGGAANAKRPQRINVLCGLLAGWASWIRTSGMRESKSRALPLGDGPLLQNGKSACEFAVPDFKWGGRWVSNPRQPEPQAGALPTELHPPYLVRPKGLEPLAHCLEGSCSIHLSYGRKCKPRSGHCLDILQ